MGIGRTISVGEGDISQTDHDEGGVLSTVDITLARLQSLIAEKERTGERRLPAETALSQEFGVSRSTIREALAQLEAQGIIERQRGSGTRIVWGPSKVRYPAHVVLALSQFLRESGIPYEVRALRADRRSAGPEVAQAMGIEEDMPVYHVDRVYDIDGSPAAYLQHYLPIEIGGERVRIEALQDGAVTFLEEVQGVKVHDVNSSITAEAADPRLAECLHREVGDPLLAMYTTLYAADGQVLALGRMVFCPDIVCLRVTALGDLEAAWPSGPEDSDD